jgi:hypothetical protein
MKIYSMEVETDLGRRVVQLAAPLDVEPQTAMPQLFRSLTEMLWHVLHESATQASGSWIVAPPKVEA